MNPEDLEPGSEPEPTRSPVRPLLRLGVPLVALLGLGWWLARPPAPEAPRPRDPMQVVADTASWDSLTSELRLAGANEPGTPLVIFGQVFDAGGHPVPNAHILVYHADASGDYGTSPSNPSWARLSGRIRADSPGRYQVRTVKPGASDGPAHVHFAIGRPWGIQQAFELRFADDRQNTTLPGFGADTGTFATVRGVVREQSGVLRVRRDFRLQ